MCANYTFYTSSRALNNAQVLHSGGKMGGKSVISFTQINFKMVIFYKTLIFLIGIPEISHRIKEMIRR